MPTSELGNSARTAGTSFLLTILLYVNQEFIPWCSPTDHLNEVSVLPSLQKVQAETAWCLAVFPPLLLQFLKNKGEELNFSTATLHLLAERQRYPTLISSPIHTPFPKWLMSVYKIFLTKWLAYIPWLYLAVIKYLKKTLFKTKNYESKFRR